MFCCLYMIWVQANATSESGSWHTYCTALCAYSSADSRLPGMHLTPLQSRLLCSGLPMFRCIQSKGLVFFPPLLFFSHIFEPCTSLGINLNPTTGKKKKTPKPIKPNPHTKTLRESLQSQFWLLHTSSAGEQP